MDKYLYHYTDANGLIGILTKGKLWASHFDFMNDAQELFYYIDNYLNPATQSYINQRADKEDIFKSFKEHYRINDPFFQPFSANLFVACFSENGNDLSMWRSYTPEGGYSIGFKESEILESLSDNEEFGRCRYVRRHSKDEQVDAFVEDLFNEKFVKEKISENNSDSFQHVMNYIKRVYSFKSVRIKNSEFEHEKEYRYTTFVPGNDEKINFRAKGSLAVPYIEMSLSKIKQVQINIGPGPYNKLQYGNLHYLGFKSKFQVNVKGPHHAYRTL